MEEKKYVSIFDYEDVHENDLPPLTKKEISEKLQGTIGMSWDEMWENESNLLGKWIRYVDGNGNYKAGGFLTCVKGEPYDETTQYIGLVRPQGKTKVGWSAQAQNGTVFYVKYTDLINYKISVSDIKPTIDEKTNDDEDMRSNWKRIRGIDILEIKRLLFPCSVKVKSEYLVFDTNPNHHPNLFRFITADGAARKVEINVRQVYYNCKKETVVNEYFVTKKSVEEIDSVYDQITAILGGL